MTKPKAARPSVLHVGMIDYQIIWDEEIPGKYGDTNVFAWLGLR